MSIRPKKYYDPYYSNDAIRDYYKETRSYRDAYFVNAYLQYGNSFGKHNVGATLGTNFDDYHMSGVSMRQDGSQSESLAYVNMTNGTIVQLVESNTAYRTLGFFGRVNYNYDEKYLFEASALYDGSSRFPQGDRWGLFPSVSVGWRISQEPFWAPLKGWWNRAKIRLSYGTLGNQQVSDYYYWDTISTGTFTYTFDGANKAGFASASDPVSDNLTWETVVSYDAGLDLGFFNDRLNFTGDVFIRDTKDMLCPSMTLPSVYGANSPKENAADMRTKGYEFQIGWKDSKYVGGHPLSYGITISLGDNLTKITKYNNPTKLLTSYYEGMILGELWGYHCPGLFKTDEDAAEYMANVDCKSVVNSPFNRKAPYNTLLAGDVIFEDTDGNGVISNGKNTLDEHGDRSVIGNTWPRYLYSIRGDLNYFGFDFSIFFQGVGRCDWMPAADNHYFWQCYSNGRPSFIASDFEKQCWSENNPDAYFPRRSYNYSGTIPYGLTKSNDRYLQDARYLRLKNLTLGYTLPLKMRVIDKCRIYFTGENLHYWSPLKKHSTVVDPEQALTTAGYSCSYPYSKVFSFGVDITF